MKKLFYILISLIVVMFIASCSHKYYEQTTTNEDKAFIIITSDFGGYPQGVTVEIDRKEKININTIYRDNQRFKVAPIGLVPGKHSIKIIKNNSGEVVYDKLIFIGHQNTQHIILP